MGADLGPPFEHPLSSSLSTTHDYVTAEATLLVGVLVVFYLTVILLLFGNNLTCPRSLLSRSARSGSSNRNKNSASNANNDLELCGHDASSRNSIGEDCGHSGRVAHPEDIEGIDGLRDGGNGDKGNVAGSCQPTILNGKSNIIKDGYKYSLVNSNDDDISFMDDSVDLDDSDDDQDYAVNADEDDNALVVDNKGEYSLSYCKKFSPVLENTEHQYCCDRSYANHPIYHAPPPPPSCGCRISPHVNSLEASSVDNDQLNCQRFLRSENQRLVAIRQQKLQYIEQQLQAHTNTNSNVSGVGLHTMEFSPPPGQITGICECMRDMPRSKSFMEFADHHRINASNHAGHLVKSSSQSIALIHYPRDRRQAGGYLSPATSVGGGDSPYQRPQPVCCNAVGINRNATFPSNHSIGNGNYDCNVCDRRRSTISYSNNHVRCTQNLMSRQRCPIPNCVRCSVSGTGRPYTAVGVRETQSSSCITESFDRMARQQNSTCFSTPDSGTDPNKTSMRVLTVNVNSTNSKGEPATQNKECTLCSAKPSVYSGSRQSIICKPLETSIQQPYDSEYHQETPSSPPQWKTNISDSSLPNTPLLTIKPEHNSEIVTAAQNLEETSIDSIASTPSHSTSSDDDCSSETITKSPCGKVRKYKEKMRQVNLDEELDVAFEQRYQQYQEEREQEKMQNNDSGNQGEDQERSIQQRKQKCLLQKEPHGLEVLLVEAMSGHVTTQITPSQSRAS